MKAAAAMPKIDLTPTTHNSIHKMSALDYFKTSVIKIRDILRGEGITGMDSMRHICLYLLSRYITCARASTVNIPAKFAWENLFGATRSKDCSDEMAMDYFYNRHADDCLIYHFDRLFKTEKFSFDIKKPLKHKEILEILNPINMDEIDCQIDILGYVYEQHLRTGSSAARDLGQFFTDRSICEYMTALCKPAFKADGVPESVCDPSMGTGGFLTSYIKYYKKNYATTPINWSIQQKEIHGCDTDAKVAGVARLNLFMETHGACATNLLTHDSLHADLTLSGYDIILANMPFGLKGLKYADVCERVKALKINGTKSEPLFLQLMMVSLNKGGRCAVVVPDGMLVNDSTCHNGTRKYLLDHFELKRIIKMKGQFFMNTGIRPSVLFFENTGKATAAVEFWDVTQGKEITEKLVLTVGRDKIDADNSYSFDLRRYMDNTDTLQDSVKCSVAKMSEIFNYENGKTLSSAEKVEGGLYDVMGGGTTYHGKTNAYNREGETISVSKSGTAGYVAYHNKKYWAGDCLTLTPKSKENSIKYLYYYLKLNNHLTMANSSGSTIPHCKWDDIKNITIPVPSRVTQDLIVAALDRIYAVVDEKIAATNIKTQMKDLMESIERRGFPVKLLADVATIESGKYITKADAATEGFPIYGGGDACAYYSATSNRTNRMVIAKDGVSLKCVRWISGPFHLNHHGWTLKCKDIMQEKFLYYYLSMKQQQIYDMASGSAQKGINQKKMEQFEVVCPPLEFQNDVIQRLDILQSYLSALKTLQKQADTNARFILESYLSTPEPTVEETNEIVVPAKKVNKKK